MGECFNNIRDVGRSLSLTHTYSYLLRVGKFIDQANITSKKMQIVEAISNNGNSRGDLLRSVPHIKNGVKIN